MRVSTPWIKRVFSLDKLSLLSIATLVGTSLAAMPASVPSADANTSVALQNNFDYALDLNGSSYLQSPSALEQVIPASGQYVIEAWIKPRPHVAGSDEYKAIVTQNQDGSGSNSGRVFLSLRWDGSAYLVHWGFGGTSLELKPGNGVPVDTWSHIALVVGSSTSALYFNGVRIGNPSGAGGAGNSQPFTIGATAGTETHFFNGQIDQVKIWNGNLGDSAANVVESMHSWGVGAVSGYTLRAYYDFNDRTALNSKVFDRVTRTSSGYHLDVVGEPTFQDVKSVSKVGVKQVFTFPRSYLTESGGWKTPDGATSLNALVVGGGGAGGWASSWNSGGGGGGQVTEASQISVTSASTLKITVAQGGVSGGSAIGSQYTTPGQSSEIREGSTLVASALGGGNGASNNEIAPGGSPSSFTGGGAGTQVTPGTAGTGVSSGGITRNGGAAASNGGTNAGDANFQAAGGGAGAGGNGGNATVNKAGDGGPGVLPALSEFASRHYGGGGAGGRRNSTGQGLGGIGGGGNGGTNSAGSAGVANTGGGGGGAGAFNADALPGGHGGSGVVVVSADFSAKCAYGTTGFTVAQRPKVVLFPLAGLVSPRVELVVDTESQAAWYGKPVLVGDKLYTADRGRGQLKRVNLDGSNVELLGSLGSTVGLGAATDGRYVYAWGSLGIARYDTLTGAFQQDFIKRGVMAMRSGEMVFYRHTDGVGYLFIPNGAESGSVTSPGRIYAVPVSGNSVATEVTNDHVFSESQLLGEAAPQALTVLAITVLNGKVYWAQQTITTPAGNIFEKEITDTNLPNESGTARASSRASGDVVYADRVVTTALWVKTMSSDGQKIFFNSGQSASIRSLNPTTGVGFNESGTGLGSQTSAGLNLLASCVQAPTNISASRDGNGAITVGWQSKFSSGATHRIEYRVNGGQWVAVATTSSLTRTFTPSPAPVGLVEVRVATTAFSQTSEFINSPILAFDAPPAPAPLCTNPTKLEYEVPAAGVVKLTLMNNSMSNPVSIDWGNGTVSPAQSWTGQFTFSNTYSTAGKYTVDVCGTFVGIYNLNTPQTYLTAVKSWGATESSLTSLSSAFNGAAKLIDVPANLPTNVTRTDFMFKGASIFNDPDVSGWVTTKVTNFGQMFDSASTFNQNIGSWDTQNATDLSGIFYNATSFNNGGSDSIKNWNTARVRNLSYAFTNAKAFNQPINTSNTNSWNVSQVQSFNLTFAGAVSFNQSLSNWNTASGLNMMQMFSGAKAFNNGLASGVAGTMAWNTANVTLMQSMFDGATAFNQNIGGWNVQKVTNMSSMFLGATVFNNGGLDSIKAWAPISATNMSYMFTRASAFNQPIIWNTSKVTSMRSMFANASSFNRVIDIEIDALTDAGEMFSFSGLSDENYGLNVIDFKTQHQVGGALNSVIFGASDKTAFCTAPNDAIRYLVTTGLWKITDKTNRTTSNYCLIAVTITADSGSHTYGDPVPSIGYTMAVSGTLPNSDWLRNITCSPKTASDGTVLVSKQAVGTSYVTECSGPTGTGLGISVTYVDGTYSVAKRPITVEAKNRVSVVGKAAITLGDKTTSTPDADDFMITSGNIADGDTLTFTLANSAPLTSGNYNANGTTDITIAAKATSPTSNYQVTAVAGKLTVSPQTYVFSAKSKVKVYGDVASFNSANGFYCETNTGDCTTELATRAVSLSSSGAGASAAVGSYPIAIDVTPGATAGSTYDFVNTNGGVLEVVKRKLTVTPVAKTVQFGSAVPVYSFNISGFAPGEGVANLPADYEPTCSSGYETTTPRGSVLAITCAGGNPGSNYQYVFETADLTVPSVSDVVDRTVRTLTVPDEDTEVMLAEFAFDLTPINQICFATLTVSQEGIAEPLTERIQVTPGSPVEFELPLYIGSYDYSLVVDGNCDIPDTVGSIGLASFSIPEVSPGVSYAGPVMTDFSTRVLDVCQPTKVTITGVRLSGISATVNSVAVKVLENTDTKLVIEVPAGLSPGSGVDLLVSSSYGLLTVQDAFDVPAGNCVIAESKGMWTKKQSASTVKFYSKSPIGMGKIQFFVNGREIAWIRAEDEENRKLSFASGYPYFVRTFTLLPGKNRLEIRVDGQRVWRSTHAR